MTTLSRLRELDEVAGRIPINLTVYTDKDTAEAGPTVDDADAYATMEATDDGNLHLHFVTLTEGLWTLMASFTYKAMEALLDQLMTTLRDQPVDQTMAEETDFWSFFPGLPREAVREALRMIEANEGETSIARVRELADLVASLTIARDQHERHVNLTASCYLCRLEAGDQTDRLDVGEGAES